MTEKNIWRITTETRLQAPALSTLTSEENKTR